MMDLQTTFDFLTRNGNKMIFIKKKMKKTIKLTENQLIDLIKKSINEQQGLYGNPTDVVDYKLPRYLSDTIILHKIENFSDVKKSLKEIHKRLVKVEQALGVINNDIDQE